MAKQTFTTGQVLTAAQMTNLQQTAMLGGAANARTASYVLVAGDAGNCVSMSNAGATTITVNTGIFAAGDIVTIINIGAGTCTITAGTATVSKPTNTTLALVQNAGGILYFTATGAATFLPFATSSGTAGGLTFISRTTFSNVASQAFDNVFSSSYFTYLVVIEDIGAATGTDDLQLQFRYAGPNTETQQYYGSSIYAIYSGSTVSSTATNNAAQLTLAQTTGTTAQVGRYYFYVNGVGNTSEKPMISGHGLAFSGTDSFTFSGGTSTERTYTGFLLKSSSTNITGTVTVYGLAKA